MKRTRVFLGLTVLSALLVSFQLWSPFSRRAPGNESLGEDQPALLTPNDSSSSRGSVETGALDESAAENAVTEHPLHVRLTNAPPARTVFNWRQVESPDYRAYVQNLRSIGCPEETVKDIVTADLLKAFAMKRAEAAAAAYDDFRFWEAGTPEAERRTEFQRQRRRVDEEMNWALRELLGTDIPSPDTSSDWQAALLETKLAFLPEDKRTEAVALLTQGAGTARQFIDLTRNRRPTEDPLELRHIVDSYEALQTALSQTLTPEEHDQLAMSVSWTADNLRRAMANFHPSEEEFRAIFSAWAAHDDELARLNAAGQSDPGNDHVFARIREVLGQKRYEEYRRTWWK